jgi:hypothetical protein
VHRYLPLLPDFRVNDQFSWQLKKLNSVSGLVSKI